MALDGLSLSNVGAFSEISPKDIAQKASEDSNANAEIALKKIEELEKQRLDPDKEKEQQKQEQKKKKYLPERAYNVEVEGIDEEKNEKILELTSQNNTYKVMYNSDKEIVEIINSKTGQISETLTLAELKGFIMKVKNPLGVIVDRTV